MGRDRKGGSVGLGGGGAGEELAWEVGWVAAKPDSQ